MDGRHFIEMHNSKFESTRLYAENYFVMLLMGRLNIYNQLIVKCQEIQILIRKLKNIIQSLRDRNLNLSF